MAKKQGPIKSESKEKTPTKANAPAKKEISSKTKTPILAKLSVTSTKFEFSAPDAGEVYLAGDFNNWDTQASPMKKDKKGTWKTTLSLNPGKYEYRYFIDGNWVSDLSCPICVPNEFGTTNCVIEV